LNLTPFLQRTRRPALQSLFFPLSAPERIAAINAEFRAAAHLRHFSLAGVAELQAWKPEALVLPLGTALTLAEHGLRGLPDLPSLSTAIVVLTSYDDTPVNAYHRDCLWRVFAVPVFEQLRGWDGNVIARECEVHDGLHVDESLGRFSLEGNELLVMQPFVPQAPPARTGLSGEIVTAHCECGAETPRLCNLMRLDKAPKASSAAA